MSFIQCNYHKLETKNIKSMIVEQLKPNDNCMQYKVCQMKLQWKRMNVALHLCILYDICFIIYTTLHDVCVRNYICCDRI